MLVAFAFVVTLSVSLSSAVFAQEPVKSPVDPQQSLAHFEVHPDFKVELVACEPNVVDPVAIRFDEFGNLWVVEMRDYPNGPADGQPSASRIRILRDNDHDGVYETAHTFADNLLFATGLQPYTAPNPGTTDKPHFGVIVTLAGQVRWLVDTDGDFKADRDEVWFEGFKAENPQLRANDPTFGPDGWVYVANGLRNGGVKAVKEDWKDQPVVQLRGQDFRFHPKTGQCEAVSGFGQFGMTFDDKGNRFVCSNRNPCNHVVLSQQYLNRNPFLVRTDVVEVVSPAAGDSRVFAVSKPWTTSTLHAGQFTAACGVTIYRGDAFPRSFYGNSFTCEPTGNLVHRDVLVPSGPTFRARYGREGVEFLASRDNWFRPVSLANGPDGGLYVVDMYRAVIEHPQFMPQELKNRRDLRHGSDRGRIYRVVPRKSSAAARPAAITEAGETVEVWREFRNGWHRDVAHRIASRKATRPTISRTNHEISRAGGVESMSFKSDEVYRLLLDLGDSKDLGEKATYAAAIAAAFPHPRHDQALLTYPPVASLPLLEALLKSQRTTTATSDLCRQIALRNRDADSTRALRLLLKWDDVNALIGLAKGLRQKGKSLESLSVGLSVAVSEKLLPVFTDAVTALAAEDERRHASAIDILQHAPSVIAVPSLMAAATDAADRYSVETKALTISAMGRHLTRDHAVQLLDDFASRTPKIQRAIVSTCVARADTADVLVQRVLDKKVPATALDAAAQRSLRRFKEPKMKQRVTNAIASLVPADRQSVLAEYDECVQLDSDPKRGRIVFEKNCATCHRIGSLGVDIGPDIADSRTRTPKYLLTNILDPNRAVDANYFSVTAITVEGKSVTGLVASESGSSITLRQAEAKTVTLLRDDIDELKSDGISLMPVGLEKTINKQQMADLISFIKNWRYLDGEIPIDLK